MSVDTPEQLQGLRRAGAVVAATLRHLRTLVRPGVTTRDLDDAAATVFARFGARSGPQLDYGFPGTICISVGPEAVHGIPGRRRLKAGELVKLDVTAELDGYYSDACITVGVGPISGEAQRLQRAANRALERGLTAAVAGAPLNAIGAAVERSVTRDGFAVCEELTGHGIGRRIHEPPTVPNVFDPAADQRLSAGTVITVEPIIAAGRGDVELVDEWTIRTVDGSLSAHAEHTIVIDDGPPLVLTR
jgi:methionyl aminopeptidase